MDKQIELPVGAVSRTNKRSTGWRRWTQFKKSNDGTAAIEFALLALPFFMILLAILEQGVFFLANRLIDIGVYQAAREIKTGQIRGGETGMSEADFRSALCEKMVMRIFDCNGLAIDVTQIGSWDNPPAQPEYNPDGSVDQSTLGFAPGGKSTVNVIRVFYDWPTVLDWQRFGQGSAYSQKITAFKNGTRRIVGSAAFLNEPYS